MEKLFEVVHEDERLLVINKPAGLVCHPTKGDVYSSLISRVRLYYDGKIQAHIINRLDRETSGLVLVAKDDLSVRELRRIWERRAVEKEYFAIVHGHVRTPRGTIDAPLGRDETSIVAVKDCVRADGAAAQTDFSVEKHFSRTEGEFTLLRVLPHTGRKHQIRIHLAHLGHPIVGDKLYGGDEDIYLALAQDRLTNEHRRKMILPWQALHAQRLRFIWRWSEIQFEAPPEPWFTEFAASGEQPAVRPDTPTPTVLRSE